MVRIRICEGNYKKWMIISQPRKKNPFLIVASFFLNRSTATIIRKQTLRTMGTSEDTLIAIQGMNGGKLHQ